MFADVSVPLRLSVRRCQKQPKPFSKGQCLRMEAIRLTLFDRRESLKIFSLPVNYHSFRNTAKREALWYSVIGTVGDICWH